MDNFRIPVEAERIRDLTQKDMLHMNVPRGYWHVTLGAIPPELVYRTAVMEYISDIPGAVDRGRGLLFIGSYGTGKTSAAIVVMKEAVARGGTAYMVDAAEIPELMIEKPRFDEYRTIPLRLKSVGFLLIDDLGIGYVKEWGRFTVERLIRYRAAHMLPTLLTTNLDLNDLAKDYRSSLEALKARNRIVDVSGCDWRDAEIVKYEE